MGLNTETRAALVFLVLYGILFVFLLLGHFTHRLPLRSRYSIITFHVTVRLASQATGVAFGIVGYSAIDLLVAYLILSAEGYFTLVLCAYRFLVSWQHHNTAMHDSWLEPRHPPGTPLLRKFLDSIWVFTKPVRPMTIIHNWLTVANAIIISGGSLLAGDHTNVRDFDANVATAKAMRVAGQAIFLSINIFLLYCLYDSIRQFKRERGGRVHPTLLLLLATWPLLFVRGLYGILSSVVPAFNYFSPSNYGEYGLTASFVISEYLLSTTMEWTSCALLMLTYVTSRKDPKKGDLKEWNNVGNNVQAGNISDA